VRVLLRRGNANHNRQDVHDQASNFCALKGGYEGVVTLLRLGRDGVAMKASCLGGLLFLSTPKGSRDVASSESLSGPTPACQPSGVQNSTPRFFAVFIFRTQLFPTTSLANYVSPIYVSTQTHCADGLGCDGNCHPMVS